MSYSKNAENLTLAKYLKIVSLTGVHSQLPNASDMWNYVSKTSKGELEGKETRFLIKKSFGTPSVGFTPVDGGNFPASVSSELEEGIARDKEMNLSVSVQHSLLSRAMKDIGRYAEPLVEELNDKTVALARILSASMFGDGSGVIGTVASVSISSGQAIVVLNTGNAVRGFVGWFEPFDRVQIVLAASTGTYTAKVSDTGVTPAYYSVESIDRENNRVTLKAYNSSNVALTIHASNHTIVAGDLILRKLNVSESGIIPVADFSAGIDMNQVSSYWNGLEAYCGLQDSGALKQVHNINLSGIYQTTKVDAGGDLIESHDLRSLFTKLFIATGRQFKYDTIRMAPEALDALVAANEVNRQFQSVEDGRTGFKKLGYVTSDVEVTFTGDEFCPLKRAYVIPTKDVLEYHGTKFDFVKVDGQKAFLGFNSEGYTKNTQQFMSGRGVFFVNRPSAVGIIHNFLVA
jgi:hypothetical protein